MASGAGCAACSCHPTNAPMWWARSAGLAGAKSSPGKRDGEADLTAYRVDVEPIPSWGCMIIPVRGPEGLEAGVIGTRPCVSIDDLPEGRPAASIVLRTTGDAVEKCKKNLVIAGLGIYSGQTGSYLARPAKTKPSTVFQSLADCWDRLEMHIRSKPKFTCRSCASSVEADAGRCYRCGVAYPASELRAVVLSPTAIPFYVVAALAFITFWFS